MASVQALKVKLKVGSLFSGIGGFDLGLERAGMKIVWQVENDPFCRRVLRKHWPDVVRYENVEDVECEKLEKVDLICGGFPCQPHSIAGKREGAGDHRNLWPEYFRVIAGCRPRWSLSENVFGIRTTILDEMLSDLEAIGYTARTLIVPACGFDAPHRRSRIFVVAHADEPGLAQRQSERADDGEGKQAAERATRWRPEPGVVRVVHGVPCRMDRVRTLGNAVVPQVAQWLGEAIMEAEAG